MQKVHRTALLVVFKIKVVNRCIAPFSLCFYRTVRCTLCYDFFTFFYQENGAMHLLRNISNVVKLN